MIKFNQIINCNIIDGKTPSTKRFDQNEIEINSFQKNYFRYWNPFKTNVPAGTIRRDISQAIIIPMAISKPNSWMILMDVVNRAMTPIAVVKLVNNIT